MKHAVLLLFAILVIFSCIHVACAGTPDLSLESIQVTPATPIATDAATLTVVVKNVGTGPHRTVTLFFGGDEKALTAFNIPMHSNSGEHGVPIPPLPAGQIKHPHALFQTKVLNKKRRFLFGHFNGKG